MKSYVYTPLVEIEGKNNIRFMTLLAGNGGSAIIIEIFNGSSSTQSSGIEYEALSYTWGDATARREIWVRNRETQELNSFETTKNLCEALFQLRSPTRDRVLWVDAVCINQLDLPEKTIQVRLMRSIYQSALRVVVWLGPATRNSDAGLSLISSINDAEDEDLKRGRTSALWNLQEYPDGLPATTDQAWYDLYDVFKRPWFRRAWIVQEIAVAREAVLICGSLTVNWKDLIRALVYVVSTGGMGTTIGFADANDLIQINTTCQKFAAESQTPFQILLRHRRALATVPVDKIFAFYGLFTQNVGRLALSEPNYETECLEVFTDVACKIFQRDENLDLLSVPRVSLISEVAGLPSWVPDWSTSDLCEPLLWRENQGDFETGAVPIYRACGNSKYSPMFDTGKKRMRLRGYLVSDIEMSSLLCQPLREDVSTSMSVTIAASIHDQKILHSIESVAQVHLPWVRHPTGENIRDVYRKTLLAGCPYADEPAIRNVFIRWLYSMTTFRLLQTFRLDQPWFLTIITYILVCLCVLAQPFGYGNQMMTWLSAQFNPFKTLATSLALRRLIRDGNQYIGLAPRLSAPGDWIVLCEGGKLPLILRPVMEDWEKTGASQTWQVIGDAYVHGLMDGRVWEASVAKGHPLMDFWIV